MEIEMTVRLLVPDTTSITAFHTLEKMGMKEIKRLRREDYYRFSGTGDFDKAIWELSKADVIVNANKHRCRAMRPGGGFGEGFPGMHTVWVLVKDDGGGMDGQLLSTLRDRLGISSVSRVERGVLWTMGVGVATRKDAERVASEAAEGLLSNRHSQEYMIMGASNDGR
jgi:phosphoribosylformylglycinamidine (FGAM) synthase PurS component